MTGLAPQRLTKGGLTIGRLTIRGLAIGALAALAALFSSASAGAYATPRLKPPAPGPTYMSRADQALLTGVAASLKRKRFAEAKALTTGVSSPVAKSLGTWMYFMAQDPAVSLAEADVFLDSHGDWPAVGRIQSFVEDRISTSAPADEVLAFFETRDPVTGDGKIALARALFASGEGEAGELHLRDAWINHNFTVSEERRILSSYGGRLKSEDHAARVDRLLWARQVTNARRVISRLNSHDRKKAQARAALLMRASSGPRLYGNLSRTDQLDPGLLHAAVRYYRRTGEEQYAISLAREAPDDPETLRNPARWWDERQLLMRWALKEGRFAEAYELAAHNGLAEGGDLAEAEFNAGWIALRFLNAPERAEAHFLALASTVGTPISLSRAYYWLARAAAARGDAALSTTYYREAAQYYYSYYGQLAAEALGGDALTREFGPLEDSTPEDKALFSSRPTVAALRMLADLDLEYEFMVFAYHVDDQLERPGEYVELAKLTNGEGAPHLTVRAGKVAVQRDAFAPDVAYPLIFVPDEATRFVSPEIILGLSRQESEFNPRAFSRAGARGVMQLIPSTALLTARKERIPYSRSALLDDPVYNITLGSAHLSHLLERFDGSLVLTLAAYNAGVNRANQWIEDFGDPRTTGVDPLDWVELVPFSETRNYVQRVLENTQVYRGRLNEKPIPGRLSGDLERGGERARIARTEAASARLTVLSTSYGAQPLAPLPARTEERVQEFKLAMTSIHREPQTAIDNVETAAPTPDRSSARNDRPRRRGVSSRRSRRGASAPEHAQPKETAPAQEESLIIETPAQTPAQTPAETPSGATPEQTEDQQAESENKAVDPAPIALAAEDTPPLAAAATPRPVENADSEVAAPAVEKSSESAPDGASLGAEDVLGNWTPIFDEDDLDDVQIMDGCLTYREFVAQSAEGEVDAADLNAGMLAELQSGGEACEQP